MKDTLVLEHLRRSPTALWIDTTEHIERLTAWIQFANDSKKTRLVAIVYNLPDRDCAANASNGMNQCCFKKPPDGNESPDDCNGDYSTSSCRDFVKYKEYIVRINNIVKEAKDIEFTLIIEPDSFPNIITNTKKDGTRCLKETATKSYLPGIDYALNTLSANTNVKLFLDMAHGQWLGWEVSKDKIASNCGDGNCLASIFRGASLSFSPDSANDVDIPTSSSGDYSYDTRTWKDKIHGFSVNVSNYMFTGETLQMEGSDSYRDFLQTKCHDEKSDDPACNDPCGKMSQYNFANNNANYAALLTETVPMVGKDVGGEHPPIILCDSGRNGNTIDLFGDDVECSLWCNFVGKDVDKQPTFGEATFAKDGSINKVPHLQNAVHMILKTPGESDGCLKVSASGAPECNTECTRPDNACTKPYLRGSSFPQPIKQYGKCPPEAGTWDDIQFDMLQSNFNKRVGSLGPYGPA